MAASTSQTDGQQTQEQNENLTTIERCNGKVKYTYENIEAELLCFTKRNSLLQIVLPAVSQWLHIPV